MKEKLAFFAALPLVLSACGSGEPVGNNKVDAYSVSPVPRTDVASCPPGYELGVWFEGTEFSCTLKP